MISSLPLAALESRYAQEDRVVSRAVLERLRRDPRKGARRLHDRLQRRYERQREERKRVRAIRRFELELWTRGAGRVAGVDEVGIGPMAGPVVAAAVVFREGTRIDAVDDSKRLEPSAREALDREIRLRAVGVGLGVAGIADVDRLNVYHAGLLAMRRAVDALSFVPDHILVDARTIPNLSVPQSALEQGDRRSFSIAAASIVAKVYRDRLMVQVDRLYPGYGFARHKGYCSPEHQAAVRKLGPCPIHRRSYDFIRELTGGYDPLFYDLKDAVVRIQTPANLREWEAGLDRARSRLVPAAVRKLRNLATRHAKLKGLTS